MIKLLPVSRLLLCGLHARLDAPRLGLLTLPAVSSVAAASSSSSASRMRHRSVVSSFILTPSTSAQGQKVAIFHRSNEVKTYQGRWAACSGSLDPSDASPEAAARREIFEETRLRAEHFTSCRRGHPFSLVDSALDTEWTIHPFAFILAGSAPEIRIDWEHSEFKFVQPDDVVRLDHVPHLEEGLQRVLLAGTETEAVMTELATDRLSGAAELGVKALAGLRGVLNGGDLSNRKMAADWWEGVKSVGWHLGVNARPSMAPAIQGAVWGALDEVDRRMREGNMGIEALRSVAQDIIQGRIEQRKHRTQFLQQHFVKYIETDVSTRDNLQGDIGRPEITIMTLSSSSTVLACLSAITLARRASIRLIVLESRPSFEGVSLVHKLLGSLDSSPTSHLAVEIVTDASVAGAAAKADYLIFGADKVHADGEVWNKLGTRAAAVLAKTLGKNCRVLVCCETNKIVEEEEEDGDDEDAMGEINEAAELMVAWPGRERVALEERMMKHGMKSIGAGDEDESGRATRGAFKAEAEEKTRGQSKVRVTNADFEWTQGEWIDAYITEDGELSKADLSRIASSNGDLRRRLFGDWARIDE